jgi:acyl carrier protein
MSTLMLNGDPEKWIIKLISDQTGVNTDQISLETRLNQDLDINGDDADELLSLYAEAFDVEMSGFQFQKYFQDEPHWLNFWRWIPGLRPNLDPITVRDLVEAARQKKWRGQ